MYDRLAQGAIVFTCPSQIYCRMSIAALCMDARSTTIRAHLYNADSKYLGVAKSNQDLTTELEQLKVIVGQHAYLLNKFMPELRVDLKRLDDKQVADAVNTALIDDKLEEYLTPLASADLISKQTKTD